MMPLSCKSHQYQMSYFVGNDFDMKSVYLNTHVMHKENISKFLRWSNFCYDVFRGEAFPKQVAEKR